MKFFRCYDFILDESDENFNDDGALGIANDMLSCYEFEFSTQNIRYAEFIGHRNGTDVYYDYGADYYFFVESTWFTEERWEEFLNMPIESKNKVINELGISEKKEDEYIDWEKEKEIINELSNPRNGRRLIKIFEKEKKDNAFKKTLERRGVVAGGGW